MYHDTAYEVFQQKVRQRRGARWDKSNPNTKELPWWLTCTYEQFCAWLVEEFGEWYLEDAGGRSIAYD